MSNNNSLQEKRIFHGRYKILSLIGKGGMGKVYLAEDLRLKGKLWAIKEIVVKKGNYQQFIDEAKMLIALDHPYLPNIIDYYPPDEYGYSYLVMDYINGLTMMEKFEQAKGNIPYKQVVRYSLQLCDLFDYLHNQQPTPIIYRDLKPSNIMIDEQDNLRLIDFGIARTFKKGKLLDTVQLGTVGFAAPEQFEDKQTDHRSDIYSLGALMYFLLSNGQYPYLTHKSINEFRKDLPQDLVLIMNQMLMESPDDRYPNIILAKRELERLIFEIDIDETELLPETLNKRKGIFYTIDQQNAIHTTDKYMNISSKLIVIANLSKRAGSTFITLNLAKYFSSLNILTSVIEMPFEPYIFDYVGMDLRLSKSMMEESFNFYSYPHVIFEDKKIERGKEAIEEGIIWLVPDPRRPLIDKAMWTYHHMMKFLYSSRKANISLLDVGGNKDHKSIEPLLDEADLVLIIVDPMPTEIMMNHKKLESLINAREEGSPIEFIINHWTSGVNKRDLGDILKIEPISFIPSIDPTFIHKAVYDCKIPYSMSEIKDFLQKPLKSVAQRILPVDLFTEDNNVEKRKKLRLNLWKR